MNKRYNFGFLTILTSLILCALSLPMFAKADQSEEDKLGYTVSIVQPSTQIDPSKGYFYVETTPGKTQELEVKVKSTKKESVKVNIGVYNAITGNNGTIDYSKEKELIDETLVDPMYSLLKLSTEKLTVSNFEEKSVKITLTPPKANYNGIKMGALVFALDTDAKKNTKGVNTEFAYRLGIITSESGDEFNNGQMLILENVKASIKRGKKMVLAKLQNPEPKTVENLRIDATMKKKGTEKLIKRKKVNNYRMAPNSNFEFEIDWGIDNLPSGQYVLNLDISNDYKEWQLSKEFSITNQQAKKINTESAFNIITPIWIKVITIILGTVEFVIMVYLIIRRVNWERQAKKVGTDI